MHHPVYYSTSPPAPGFYASPPLALSPPSVQMLTIAMGGSQPGTVSSSPPMGYPMAAQPMAAQPMAVPGQMLFAQQYMSPDGSSYGVQMAVSPPARDIGGYGYGGGIDITGVAHHDESGGSAGGGGYVSGEAPPPQHYPGAHGFYGQDGQYYVNPGVVAAPQTGYEYQLGMQQGYYAGLQSGAYAAPAPGVGPQMTLRVNTANGGGDANGYAAHQQQQQQPQGGNAQHWQRNSNAGGRGPERGRRRSGSGATGGKLQHSSGSGSSAHSFGSGDGEPGSPKVERHRGRRGRGGGNGGDSVDSKTDGQQGLEELSFEELSFAD
jgi:hypothetical protein